MVEAQLVSPSTETLQDRPCPAPECDVLHCRPPAIHHHLERVDQALSLSWEPGKRGVLSDSEVVPAVGSPLFRTLGELQTLVDIAVHAVRMRRGDVVLHHDFR